MQARIASDESITQELFKTALRLAAHRGLLDPETPHLDKARRDFAEEISKVCARIVTIAEFHRSDAR